MPEPVQSGQRYMPGLDGLRAIAVLAVMAYHLGFGWAPGGLLGVGVFFTLSGYLITDLLLAQIERTGRVRLAQFWLARARRLLPALLVMLAVVAAWVTVIGPHQPSDFRAALVTGALYVNNWWSIFHDVSYFETFQAPGPLNHLWSLSVEEQFYLVWPLLIIGGVRLVPAVNERTGTRPLLAVATVALAVASAVLMIGLYEPSLDPSRVYYGTDTRALELLAGAALAMVWPSRRLRRKVPRKAKRVIDGIGLAGLAGILLMVLLCGEFDPFLYRGGFVLLSLFTVMAVASLAHPASRLSPLVGCSWMRWIGVRSYGIYLWHFPVIALTTPNGADGPELLRTALQVAATFAIAAVSWRYLEDPIRHGAIGRLASQVRAAWQAHQNAPGLARRGVRSRLPKLPRKVWVATGAAALVAAAAFAALVGVNTREPDPAHEDVRVSREVVVPADDESKKKKKKKKKKKATSTSCDAVVHIGDSTSLGLESKTYLPQRKRRISARYAQVGATKQRFDISGGTSIFEPYGGRPNAAEVAKDFRRKRFRGCWVLALGTNEAANVAVGSNVGLDERIDMMMDAIGSQPVMWLTVKTLVGQGPYAADNMEKWNKALRKACKRHPNMRVYDWAADVKKDWFTTDGIHFTTPGYAARAKLISRALLESFPAGGRTAATGNNSGCVVRPPAPKPKKKRKKRKTADGAQVNGTQPQAAASAG